MIICDLCAAKVAWEQINKCHTCDDAKQYCKPCLKKLSSKDGTERYCPSHWDVAKNALSSTKILSRYVHQFWKELGIEPEISERYYDERNHFRAEFYGLHLVIEYSPNFDESGNLISINHMVDGLVTNQKTYVVPIHNHEEARTKVKQAVITALKNKKVAYKAAKAKKLNEIERIVADYDQRLASVDFLIKKWTNGNLRPVQEQNSRQSTPS